MNTRALLLTLGLVSGIVSSALGQEHNWPPQHADFAVEPNPFREIAQVSYHLPEPCRLTLKVYDATGAVAAVICEDRMLGRTGSFTLDGRGLAEGYYLLMLQAGPYVSVKPVVKLGAGTTAAAQFLNIWPTARSAALAGATTAMADESDVLSPNPGGLGFQKSFRFGGVFGQLLPSSSAGMLIGLAGVNVGFPSFWGKGTGLSLGLKAAYAGGGAFPVFNLRGDYLGSYEPWQAYAGARAGAKLSEKLGFGLSVGIVASRMLADWVTRAMPEQGIEHGGLTTAFAADVGVLYKPIPKLALGFACTNLGSKLASCVPGESDWLPAVLRLGFRVLPVGRQAIQPNLLFELDQPLYGRGGHPTRLLDLQKSLAFELSAWRILYLRAAYFEDLGGARGGVVFDDQGSVTRVGLLSALFGRPLGELKSVGVCYGFGLGYRDYVRLDVSNEALVYAFAANTWKFTLATDLPGLFRALRGRADD